MSSVGWPSAKLVTVIVVMVVAETSWALYCAESGFNLLGFYLVLVVASAVFWIPGLSEKRASTPPPVSSAIAGETNR
jgi:hypothetical protein